MRYQLTNRCRALVWPVFSFLIIVFGGCQRQFEDEKRDMTLTQLADSISVRDPVRKTASLRYRVTDVQQTTQRVEAILRKMGGELLHADTHNENSLTQQIRVSRDSLIERTSFVRRTDMECRIPVAAFDSGVMAFEQLAGFLEQRVIDARHVKTDRLDRALDAELGRQWAARVDKAIGKGGHKLSEVDAALQSWKQAGDEQKRAIVAQRQLEEQTTYAYVQLSFYQLEQAYEQRLPYRAPLEEFEPGFLEKLSEATAGGWDMLLKLLLFVASGWPLWLLLAAGWFLLPAAKRRQLLFWR
ncbi:MAG: DUF4349 domain-containing protein [Flavihumibacter sp.]